MGEPMTVAAEPACPAMVEAAAIVEAEWIRLRRSGAPVRHAVAELPVCELPEAERCRRRPLAAVTTERGRGAPLGGRGERGSHWAARIVWARGRSPPHRS
jgi:hypothetical protein